MKVRGVARLLRARGTRRSALDRPHRERTTVGRTFEPKPLSPEPNETTFFLISAAAPRQAADSLPDPVLPAAADPDAEDRILVRTLERIRIEEL